MNPTRYSGAMQVPCRRQLVAIQRKKYEEAQNTVFHCVCVGLGLTWVGVQQQGLLLSLACGLQSCKPVALPAYAHYKMQARSVVYLYRCLCIHNMSFAGLATATAMIVVWAVRANEENTVAPVWRVFACSLSTLECSCVSLLC
jgi:hypothetical protein